MKYIILLLTVIGFWSCMSSNESGKIALPIAGVWLNTYMKVEMKTYKGTDSTKIMEVNEESWENTMGIRPIETHFNENGTYNSIHRNLHDSIIYNPAGKWFVKGDSLFMNDTFPEKGIGYKYRFVITTKDNETVVEFWGHEDFDQDGRKDDLYYGRQRKAGPLKKR